MVWTLPVFQIQWNKESQTWLWWAVCLGQFLQGKRKPFVKITRQGVCRLLFSLTSSSSSSPSIEMWWWIHENDVFSVSYTGSTQEKIRVHPSSKLQEISESQEPITRGLSAPVRAKATKLGSCDKHPAYFQDKNVKVGLSAMMKIRWCIALILRLLVCSQYKVVAKFIFFSHYFFHKIERITAYLTVMIIPAFIHSAVQIYEIHIFKLFHRRDNH